MQKHKQSKQANNKQIERAEYKYGERAMGNCKVGVWKKITIIKKKKEEKKLEWTNNIGGDTRYLVSYIIFFLFLSLSFIFSFYALCSINTLLIFEIYLFILFVVNGEKKNFVLSREKVISFLQHFFFILFYLVHYNFFLLIFPWVIVDFETNLFYIVPFFFHLFSVLRYQQ